jgi:undecaprenyl-diphosphatase
MLFHAAVLGVVQGLTEFLPVSSSGHLILARALLGWDAEAFGIAFDVAIHVGTLLGVVVYFAPELARLVRAAPRALAGADDEAARQVRHLVAGTLPVVPAGLLYTSEVAAALRTPAVAAAMLGLGGVLLVVADCRGRRNRTEAGLTLLEAVAIGVAQAVSLVPGVSRSGATMTVALWFGLRREAAARFSFLLGVPAILAAASLTGLDALREGLPPDSTTLMVVGVSTAGVVGYLTVKYFLRYVSTHSLRAFAYYRFVLAAGVGLWLLA